MKSFLLIAVAVFLLFPLVSAVSCSVPDLNITEKPARTYVGQAFSVTLTLSANPPPSTTCPCLGGSDCGLSWQTDFNGSWTQIPQNTTPTFDLNCSGNSCDSGKTYPIEDKPLDQNISCVDQAVFHIRGYHEYTNTTTPPVTVYCYPTRKCTPPVNQNFDVNETCTFIDVPVIIDKNYNIKDNGYVSHNNSDINFTGGASIQKITIRDGGRMDLNHSIFINGLTIDGPAFGFIGLFAIGLLGLFWLSRQKWKSEAMG